MQTDPTRRFSSRVADYVRYRSSYPREMLAVLETECGLRPRARVADIGPGTGILAKLFLDFGCEVWGVEPNADMRRAGEQFLASYPQFHSIAARAEETTLAEASVDFVAAGQAFHWFDQAQARAEFRRILREPRWVVLVWNERLVEGRFLEEYEAILLRYCADYAKVDHRHVDAPVMDRFFVPGKWRLMEFPNDEHFDLESVVGRLHSSSYAPVQGTAEYDAINAEVTALFRECAKDGRVDLRQKTSVYWGCV